MRAPLSKSSIRTLLILLFVPIIVLDVGLTGYLAFRNGQIAVTDLARQLQTENTARITDHLQSYLEVPHMLNQINLNAIALGHIDPADFATLEPHFWRQTRQFAIGGVTYADERGEYLNLGREEPDGPILAGLAGTDTNHAMEVYTTDDQGRRMRLTQLYADYDPRLRPWYRQAVAVGRPAWTPIFLWTNGALGMDAVAPLYEGRRQLTGVLDVSLTLDDISRFLRGLKVGQTGTTFIIDREGLIIASSSDEAPYIENGAASRLSTLASQVPMIRGAASKLFGQFGGFATIQDQQTFDFDLDTGRHLAQVTPYRDPHGLDWLIVVVVPEADFMGRIDANSMTTALLVVVSLLIAIGIAIGTADRITRPICALNQSAKDFASGHWYQTPPRSGVKEIAELASSFGSMAGQLQMTFATLQTKEQRLREALDAAKMGTWEWSISEHAVTWSEQVAPLYGLRPGEYSGDPDDFLALIHPEDRQRTAAMIEACLEQHRTAFEIEHRAVWADGSLHWLEAKGRIICDAHDRPLRLRGTVAEITARKRADEALRESQDHYRIISELVSSYAYAYRCDADGGLALEWVTDSFTRITGYGVQQLGLIADWDAAISDADRGRIQRHRQHILAGEKQDMVEYGIVASDGRLIWLREYQQPIWDAGAGRVVRLYGAAQDITRFKQLEQQLQQAQKMEAIGRLAGGIAHDFNNLLTVILGNCSLIAIDIDRANPAWNDIAAIQDAATRATMLTRQLLAFSRQQVLQPRPLALNTVVVEMGHLMQRLIGEDVSLILRLSPELGFVQADPSQLEQVVMNLAINARDAMPGGGTLVIETAEQIKDERRWALLSVHDSGTGMDAFTQAHIFEPFFTTKGIGKGTGLGLATVHGIILQSGGQIEVDSAPGQGSTFRIYLPLISATAEQQPEPKQAQALPHGEGTILLVEDEAPVRELVARVLNNHGYSVIEAVNGTQALQIGQQRLADIDLLLTDMVMPGGLTGHQLAEQLQAHNPALKVLYISGYTDPLHMRPVDAPNRNWLQKPFTPDLLVRKVRDILLSAA